MPTATLTRPVRDAPTPSTKAADLPVASAGLTLDTPGLGTVDMVVIERAHRGLTVELTLAEAVHLLGLSPNNLGPVTDKAEPTPADVRDARIRRARTAANCKESVIDCAKALVTLYLLGAELA